MNLALALAFVLEMSVLVLLLLLEARLAPVVRKCRHGHLWAPWARIGPPRGRLPLRRLEPPNIEERQRDGQALYSWHG